MLNAQPAARRALPAVDRLLRTSAVESLILEYGRPLVAEAVRELLDGYRSDPARMPLTAESRFDEHGFATACAALLRTRAAASLTAVFNLTGTVLHTNLGRAVMPEAVAKAVAQAMTRPVNLEFDLGTGDRGERDTHIERWLTKLTGAEAAVVVNNNAAAVYLVLNTLALRREVPVSRGELIEIGGSFRMPDIMARAGVKLVEVGTTNRTHHKDYAAAISLRTAAIMKVHPSNYAIQGFTATVPESELAALAHEHGLPFVVDLGSGMLVDLEEYGLPHEPTPRETLARGADLVTFSGDKLLGGPQAGLIVGSRELILKIRRNPMKRALRVDKMTLAALEAVLRIYADPRRLRRELPTLRWLTRPLADIESQVQRILPHIAAALSGIARASVITCSSQVGSGSLPVDSLPSSGIALTGTGKARHSFAARISAAFRRLPVPVIGRVREGTFVLDLRCLDDEETFVAQLDALRIEAP